MFEFEGELSNDVVHFYRSTDGRLEVEISISRAGHHEHLSCQTYYTNKNGDCVGAFNPTVIGITWSEMFDDGRKNFFKEEVCEYWRLDPTSENEQLILRAVEYMYSHKMYLFRDKQDSKEFLDRMAKSYSGYQMAMEFDEV
jgi:hypothetical protein